MPNRLPHAAWLLGVAGLIPFIACALVAIGSFNGAQADRGLAGLIAYGSVILSFLGGIHWGLALGPPVLNTFGAPSQGAANISYPTHMGGPAVGEPNLAARLALGVVPTVIGWLALLAFILLNNTTALIVMIAGFLLTVAGEVRLRRGNHLPHGYLTMRYVLTAVVTLTLATVLTVNLIGAKIVF